MLCSPNLLLSPVESHVLSSVRYSFLLSKGTPGVLVASTTLLFQHKKSSAAFRTFVSWRKWVFRIFTRNSLPFGELVPGCIARSVKSEHPTDGNKKKLSAGQKMKCKKALLLPLQIKIQAYEDI